MNQMTNKPYSQACENNKRPILDIISQYFQSGLILEVGSGTGQHAVFFASGLPAVFWQTSDRLENHSGINLWISDFPADNLARPVALDVNQAHWPLENAAGVFSANTAHIMDWDSVKNMFQGVSRVLEQGGHFCLYGPVNINGDFTSASNEAFDQHLRQRDPTMGIRDLEALQELAKDSGLAFVDLHQMPANNVIMVWRKE